MLRVIAFWLLFFQSPSGCEDEMELRWNEFAHAANTYVHVRDARPEQRMHDKHRLKQLWDAVYGLDCF